MLQATETRLVGIYFLFKQRGKPAPACGASQYSQSRCFRRGNIPGNDQIDTFQKGAAYEQEKA